MGARGSMGTAIGGAEMSAYRQRPHMIAPAATPHLAMMKGSGVAAAPIAPEAVSGGTKTRGTRGIVLSGRQPSAPLASPST